MATHRKKRSRTNAIEDPPTSWSFVGSVLRLDEVRTIYIWGPPGVGKTHAAYRLGRTERGVFAVTLTEDTAAAELRGHWIASGREMVWHDGPFTRAMRDGARLVVNELSHAPPEVHSLLYPVLESDETARLTLPTNETVRPAAGFHVVCTDNVPPDDLAPALQDRFDCVLEITEPHPDALARLHPRLRRAAEQSFGLPSERRIGLRGWLAIQRLEGPLGLPGACVAVLGAERGRRVHDAIVLASPRRRTRQGTGA